MEPAFFSALVNGLVSTGLPSMLMGAAIWWLQKFNAAWINTLNIEREARIHDHEFRINDLQKRSDLCESDRIDLRQKMFELMHKYER